MLLKVQHDVENLNKKKKEEEIINYLQVLIKFPVQIQGGIKGEGERLKIWKDLE